MSKPKIFILTQRGGFKKTDYISFALAEDGTGLCSHLSSSVEFAKHDMGLTSDWKHEVYQRHYPNGYELEWVENPDSNEEFKAAHRKNQEQKREYDSKCITESTS